MRHLSLKTAKPLQFPSQCIACAAETNDQLVVTPHTGGEAGTHTLGCLLGVIPFAGPLFSLGVGLSKKKVELPMCKGCKDSLLVPSAKAGILLVLMVIFLGLAFYASLSEKGLMSVITWSGFVVTMLLLLVIASEKGRASVPVEVEQSGKNLRYKIYESSPYFEAWADTPNAKIVEN